MSNCRSCNADILWARTERGSRMPLDAEPVDSTGRNLFVLRDKSSSEGPLAIAAWGLAHTEPHYVSHFATCPNADQHRRTT